MCEFINKSIIFLMRELLKKLKKANCLLFIDFEGTQFTHEIIAVGAVKCYIVENGNLLDYDKEGLKCYVKARSQIGPLVSKMTSINESLLKEKGISWDEAILMIDNYLGDDKDNACIISFGNNDARMIHDSNRYSHPKNLHITKKWFNHYFDFLTFINNYIRDERGNNYSLVNYLHLFNLTPHGVSHDPLNDAFDLMNLFFAFLKEKDIVYSKYLNVLLHEKKIPDPIKSMIKKLSSGLDLSSEEFKQMMYDYLK